MGSGEWGNQEINLSSPTPPTPYSPKSYTAGQYSKRSDSNGQILGSRIAPASSSSPDPELVSVSSQSVGSRRTPSAPQTLLEQSESYSGFHLCRIHEA